MDERFHYCVCIRNSSVQNSESVTGENSDFCYAFRVFDPPTRAPYQMTTDKQLWWWRGNDGTDINGKQQSTNVQHAQRRTSGNNRMRWRTTAAEQMRWMEQRTSNYGWWQRGDNGADDNDKKQQPRNVQRQRRRMCAAQEAEDDDGWREAGHGGGGGGATVVRRWRRNSFARR
jgi:hypothetical protein